MLTVTASIYPQVHCSVSLLFYIAFLKITVAKHRYHQLDQQIKMVTEEVLIPFCSGSHSMFINIITT